MQSGEGRRDKRARVDVFASVSTTQLECCSEESLAVSSLVSEMLEGNEACV